MKALIYHAIYGYVGGIERYIHQVGSLFKKENWTLYGLFERKVDNVGDFGDIFDEVFYGDDDNIESLIRELYALEIEVVFVHKSNNVNLLSALNKNFYTISTIHDHDYYCFRKHKYFPVKRINCPLPMNKIYCSICSLLLKRDRDKALGFSLINAQEKIALTNEVKDADATIVLSKYMMRNLDMNKWNMDTVYRIYPIHEVSEIRSAKKTEGYNANYLFVGQLIRGKGVDILIEACRQLKHDYSLKIVGNGNDYDYLKKLIRMYGLDKKIQLVGWVDDVTKYYSEADLVIVPSRWQEPFGLIGIEAFSRMVPVVGFNIGGISEWLHHKENGYLVKKKDSQGLIEALEYIQENPQVLEKWGKAGYNYVKENYCESCFLTSIKNILKQAKVKF
jgi:glycosyltransferase involved in cell wall biosynthesis